MKEIIPLKKDILFKTKIGELTDISLNHDYKIKDDLVEGTVSLNGSYKLTEASINNEDFFYQIPFSMALSDDIDKDTINIEIDEFNYDIDSYTLKVNIDLLFTCDKKEEYYDTNIIDIDNTINESIIEESTIKENNVTNITNNFNVDNAYYTYKVYIVREGDTIESISNKYNIDSSIIKEYNNIEEIHEKDKIIIPQINE